MAQSPGKGGLGKIAKLLWHGFRSGSTREFYDAFSEHYDEVFAEQRVYAEDTRAFLSDYLSQRGKQSLEVALEAGCGTGVYSSELLKVCTELHGIDFSSGQIRQLSEKGLDMTLTNGNILALPYPDETFDFVGSLGVLRHLPGREADYFREAYRVLKPGGICLAEPIPLALDDLAFPLRPAYGIMRLLPAMYDAFMRLRGLDEQVPIRDPAFWTEALESAGFQVGQFREKRQWTYDFLVGVKPQS